MRLPKDFNNLSYDDKVECAFMKIVASCNISEQSSHGMLTKLRQAGFPSDISSKALDRATSLGIVDDKRYIECLVRFLISSGKGLSKAEREMTLLGIDPTSVEEYVSYTEEGAETDLRRAVDVLLRHPPKSKNPYASCVRKVVAKGFSPSIAYKAAREYLDNYAD